nr:Shedu anti-phage system protein SduA domain-containing protein [Bacillus sp. LK2]
MNQVFASSLLLFKGKTYIGGKGLDNKEGKVVDFIFKNSITNDIALIEIKTPRKKLLSNEYRHNVFSIHPDLSGAIVQVLSYKDKIQKGFNSLSSETEE